MGERLNISLDKGIHRKPTLGQEGELSELVNMIPKNGQLTPISECTVDFSYPDDSWTLLYVHENAGYKHYIHAKSVAAQGGTAAHVELYWTDATDIEPSGVINPTDMIDGITVAVLDDIYKISHMGNTLILLLSIGIFMAVFKYPSNYAVLSADLPTLNISFGLDSVPFTYKYESGWGQDGWDFYYIPTTGWRSDTLDEQNIDNPDFFNQKILATRNKLVADAINDNYFVFPFFVRYAFILKDGSITRVSPPVMMTPSTDNPCISHELHKPWVDNPTRLDPPDYGHTWPIIIRLIESKLNMVIAQAEAEAIAEYGDIIESVGIFVSEQFYTYEQDGEYTKGRRICLYNDNDLSDFHLSDNKGGVSYTKLTAENARNWYMPMNILEIANWVYKEKGSQEGDEYLEEQFTEVYADGVIFTNPRKSDDELSDEITNCNAFYLLSEIPINELTSFTTRKNVHIKDHRLKNITSAMRLEGEDEEADDKIAKTGFVYNQRLNISQVKTQVKNKYSVASLINYTNIYDWCLETTYTLERGTYLLTVIYVPDPHGSPERRIITRDIVTIKIGHTYNEPYFYDHEKQSYLVEKNNRQVVLASNKTSVIAMSNSFYFIAVPGVNAKKIWLYDNVPTPNVGIVKDLAPSKLIPISYWFGGIGNNAVEEVIEVPQSGVLEYIDNSVQQSEAGNPWKFPTTLVKHIGNGDIVGMGTTAKAMSTGQYGQFPLVVFSTDGIWSMQVNEDGTYKSAVFVSGDVCSNPGSITQTDNAILFVTRQGLKYIIGSEVKLLTAMIEGTNIDDSDFIPDNTDWGSIVVADTADKRESFQDCKIVYDYVDRLIHVFNSETSGSAGKHECLSLESGEYASEVQIIDDTENTKLPQPRTIIARYPVTLFQVGNDIYSYKGADLTEPSPRLGYLITRPMAFGDYTKFKTIMDLRIYSDIQPVESPNDANGTWCILYGSNDKNRWVRLNSCKGMPFKFFRIAIVTRLGNDDTLSGISLEYEERRGNKMK